MITIPKKESLFFLLLINLVLALLVWSLIVELRSKDPDIAQKYEKASEDISTIKAAIIAYYCQNGRIPATLNDLVPETLARLPVDPWGNDYVLTSLAWRTMGSGIDVVSKGGDGRTGGKGWKCDIIGRIDRDEITCP